MSFVNKLKSIIILMVLVLISIPDSAHANYQGAKPCIPEPCCIQPCCNNLVVSGGLLYWRTLQDGLACSCNSGVNNQWNLGYRVGLEYDCCSQGWKNLMYWTHFHNHSKKENGDEDHFNWDLDYDTIDVLFGYEFYRNCCFSYTPSIGVRGIKVKEKLKSHFTDSGCDCTDSEFIILDQDHKQRFWGVGPELGLGANWKLGCGFSLYGEIGVGLLYGKFKVNVDDNEILLDATDDGRCCFICNTDVIQNFADFAVGVELKKCVCRKIEAILRLGWEHHRYYNYNHIGGYGDLSLDGAVFHAGLKF